MAAISSPRLPAFDIALWTTSNRLLALYRECECKEAERVESEFLIIIAADDRVVTPQPSRDFAALIDAQLIELDEDCGHGTEPGCAVQHGPRSC